jgi:hypothetical protein
MARTRSEGSFPENVCVRATTSNPTALRQPLRARDTRIALTFVEEHDGALQLPRRIRPGDVQVVEHV